jgi:hypothetical protein
MGIEDTQEVIRCGTSLHGMDTSRPMEVVGSPFTRGMASSHEGSSSHPCCAMMGVTSSHVRTTGDRKTQVACATSGIRRR